MSDQKEDRFITYLPQKEIDRLEHVAQTTGRSKGAVISEALDSLLEELGLSRDDLASPDIDADYYRKKFAEILKETRE